MTQARTILVTGPTGAQGGAVIDALAGTGISIRALVRDPASSGARALAARGVVLMQGDFDDEASLDAAASGADAVFSVQIPPRPGDRESEVRTGRKLVEAARKAGVTQFIHTSVARAGEQEQFAGWAERRWWPTYWTSKAEVNRLVREAGFEQWTILKPAYMMDNFIQPKSGWMFPGLAARGAIETAMSEGSRLDLIAAADVGRMVAAAISDPVGFLGKEIPLAADSLTMREVADVIASAAGKPVGVRYVSAEQAVALGNAPGLTESQQWASIEGYRVDIPAANSHGITLERFHEWAARMRDQFEIGES